MKPRLTGIGKVIFYFIITFNVCFCWYGIKYAKRNCMIDLFANMGGKHIIMPIGCSYVTVSILLLKEQRNEQIEKTVITPLDRFNAIINTSLS